MWREDSPRASTFYGALQRSIGSIRCYRVMGDLPLRPALYVTKRQRAHDNSVGSGAPIRPDWDDFGPSFYDVQSAPTRPLATGSSAGGSFFDDSSRRPPAYQTRMRGHLVTGHRAVHGRAIECQWRHGLPSVWSKSNPEKVPTGATHLIAGLTHPRRRYPSKLNRGKVQTRPSNLISRPSPAEKDEQKWRIRESGPSHAAFESLCSELSVHAAEKKVELMSQGDPKDIDRFTALKMSPSPWDLTMTINEIVVGVVKRSMRIIAAISAKFDLRTQRGANCANKCRIEPK
ncbi:hypothetical protein C8R46DRAFT_1309197 [Mycena filopes]|nr:hypothetical protein C8R46DRAFT_1309197 [Mycena filopes]